MRQQRLETQPFVSRENGTDPGADGVAFTVGAGRECREVDVIVTLHPGHDEDEVRHEVHCLLGTADRSLSLSASDALC